MAKTEIRGYQVVDYSITELDVNFSGSTVLNNLTTGDTYLVLDSTSNNLGVKRISSSTIPESLRSNISITPGSIITVNNVGGVGYINWGDRFRIISNGRGNNFSTEGYFDIICPTTGTITGVGGASNVTATSNGIPLSSWQSLYYILPIGSGSTSISSNFRIVSYTSNIDIPHNWVLICNYNSTSGVYHFPLGIKLKIGESINITTHDSVNTDKLDGYHLSDITAFTETRYVNVTGDTMSGQLTVNDIIDVNGEKTYYTQYKTGNTPTLVDGLRRLNPTIGTTELKLVGHNATLQDGFELYGFGYNNTSNVIPNGKAITVVSGFSDVNVIRLAIGSNDGNEYYEVAGVTTEDIQPYSYGVYTKFGEIHDLDLSYFNVNDDVFLSQTVEGGFAKSSDLNLHGRSVLIGKVVNNSATEGVLSLEIENEVSVLDNTRLEINTFTINDTSTGVFEFGGIIKTSNTTFSIGQVKGWVVDNETNPIKPSVKYVEYSGSTGNTTPYINSNVVTYILLNSNGQIVLQPTSPTASQRREQIYLGKIGHTDKTNLTNALQNTDSVISPLSQIRDMFIPIPMINGGVYPYFSTGLTMYNTAGILYGLGINFPFDNKNPNTKTILANVTGTTFQYRTQTGGTATNRTTIDPLNYDVNGVITPIGSPAKTASNQRIYLLQDGSFRVQYGQVVYDDLNDAKLNVSYETFIPFPGFKTDAILIGVLSLVSNATDLSNPLQAQLFLSSKFGELIGGGGGGGAGTNATLQLVYNNSSTPEIVTNDTLKALTLRRGSSNDSDNVLEILNGSSQLVSSIDGSGNITGTTFVKSGGTSDQYLMGDGSVSTLSSLDSRFVNITGDTTNYLIVTGSSGSGGNGIEVSYGIQGNILKSTATTGISPIEVQSTTLVTNLNADLLDGLHASQITANTITYSDSRYVNVTGDTMTGSLVISGNTSGSTSFQVIGSTGTLFSVVDTQTGTLFQVSDISGIPILQVDSSGYIVQNSGNLIGLTGTTGSSVYNINKYVGTAAYFDYRVSNPTTGAYRAGTVTTVWDSTNNRIEYNETCTTDIFASTDGFSLFTRINGDNIELVSSITTGTWNLKLGCRVI